MPLKLCIFGCAPDTGNLGVSALLFSTLSGLAKECHQAEVTVFDYGKGHRWGSAWMGSHALHFALHGGRYSRRLYDSSNLWNIRMCARFGGLGNPGAEAILEADALLDVSGGDSFTDLYGPQRFKSITAFKDIAHKVGKPLVLLPQTYGPFRGDRERGLAEGIVRKSSMAWARDPRSYDTLKQLLGQDYDPKRHRCGVDLAFGLPAAAPRILPTVRVEEWLDSNRSDPVVGLNVSGLIYNDPSAARTRYGLVGDYRKILAGLIKRFLDQTSANLILIAHVIPNSSHHLDDDSLACGAVLRELEEAGYGGRVAVVGRGLNPSEIKSVISRLDWFCGTRMHSTIAALSSGVPAAAIAYSGKTLGVFETCDQGAQVADPRELETRAVIDLVWNSWCERDRCRETLAAALPGVVAKSRQQLHEIAEHCSMLASTGEKAALGGTLEKRFGGATSPV